MTVLAHRRPDLAIFSRTTSSFDEAAGSDEQEYSRTLANCRIVLAPRGTNPETFRYFEGHKYGCIVIHETLPHHWFYPKSSPLQVQRWREMQEIIDDLLPPDGSREHALQQHSAAQARWDNSFSPRKIGEFVTDAILSTLDESPIDTRR